MEAQCLHTGPAGRDPNAFQIFYRKWMDKNKGRVYKSRFTCADIKAKCTAAEEEKEMNLIEGRLQLAY